jgi:hypothetical protein
LRGSAACVWELGGEVGPWSGARWRCRRHPIRRFWTRESIRPTWLDRLARTPISLDSKRSAKRRDPHPEDRP